MKKEHFLFLPLVLGGGGFLLRVIQCITVFDPATGLARPHIMLYLPPLYLFAVLLLFVFLARRQSKGAAAFDDVFLPPTKELTAIFVAGALLMLACGGLFLFEQLVMRKILPMVVGALAIAAGVALFLAVYRWRREDVFGNLLLLPVLFEVVRLLDVYRLYSSHPVMTLYYVPVLAVAAAAFAFYQLSAFAFSQGSRRMLHVFLPMGIVLSMTALADAVAMSEAGMHLGAATVFFAFWFCKKD